MSETTPRTSGRAAAAAAAKALLADRITLVEELGDALDVHRRKTAAVEAAKRAERDAADAARVAHTAALAGGWTKADLRAAGLDAPQRPAEPNGPRPTARPSTTSDVSRVTQGAGSPSRSTRPGGVTPRARAEPGVVRPAQGRARPPPECRSTTDVPPASSNGRSGPARNAATSGVA